MKSFAFDIGDSSKGPIGAVIRVKAETEEEAIAAANHALDVISCGGMKIETGGFEEVEYFNVYLNEGLRLTKDNIGDVEDVEEEGS